MRLASYKAANGSKSRETQRSNNKTNMNKLETLRQFVGKIVKATSANDYGQLIGKCLNVRECISDYTDINKGIRYLADIENAGNVRVALADTMSEAYPHQSEQITKI